MTYKSDSAADSLQVSSSLLTLSQEQKTIAGIQLNPPLKWAGGKRWLISRLKPFWEKHKDRRYVEPFGGGLAVALGLRPQRALLNDINIHLVNFYTQVQRGLEITIELRNDEKLFYDHRSRFNRLIDEDKYQTAEAAQLFYYLNRTCFNGLCRFNQAGRFNVPFGSFKTIRYAASFHEYRNVFKNWEFMSCDLAEMPLASADFVYADPPYDVEFTSYSPGGFSWEDQVRAAELLAAHPGPVVLSNQATPRIVSLYKKLKFTSRFVEGPRRISCTGDRQAVLEILALKNI